MLGLYQVTHMDPDIYEEPNRFKYDRFVNEDGSEKRDFYKNGERVLQYFKPFGMGRR